MQTKKHLMTDNEEVPGGGLAGERDPARLPGNNLRQRRAEPGAARGTTFKAARRGRLARRLSSRAPPPWEERREGRKKNTSTPAESTDVWALNRNLSEMLRGF